ncbi:Chloroperoxidase, partial [Mycena rosella]
RRSTFDSAAQYINVTGPHAFSPPGPNDMRGPCPGLNSLANHNFIPHTGIVSLTAAIDASFNVYGMAIDFANFAGILGYLYGGNLATLDLEYSIGGPPPGTILSGLFGKPPGLSFTHNQFEADSSATRGDYFQFNHNGYDLQLSAFTELYNLQQDSANPNYDLDVLLPHRLTRYQQSVAENEYFFYGPVQMLFSSVTHFFIPGLMSNHSAEFPDGILSNEVLASIYGISSDPSTGALSYTRGYERIPDNWYRRPIGGGYSAVNLAADLARMAVYNPQLVVVGGNINGVNTFAPLDITAFTGGVYNSAMLLEGNNTACFVLQTAQQLLPAALQEVEGLVAGLLQQLDEALGGMLSELTCPQMLGVDASMLEQYPGY